MTKFAEGDRIQSKNFLGDKGVVIGIRYGYLDRYIIRWDRHHSSNPLYTDTLVFEDEIEKETNDN